MYEQVHHFIHKSTKLSTGGRGPPLPHLPPLGAMCRGTCAYNDFTPSYAPESKDKIFSEVGTAENKIKDYIWCSLALFETMLKMELLRKL